jgi:hypothetical protein
MNRFVTRGLPVIIGVATVSALVVALRADSLGVERADAAGEVSGHQPGQRQSGILSVSLLRLRRCGLRDP